MTADIGTLNGMLQCAFDESPLGIVVLDDKGRILHGNHAFGALTGLDVAALSGQLFSAIDRRLSEMSDPAVSYSPCPMPGAGCASCVGHGRALSNCDIVLSQPYRVLRRTLRIPTQPGTGVAAILYFQDVTRESATDRLKGEFMVTVAHELRTPMTSIHGYAELLLISELDETQSNSLIRSLYKQSRSMVVVLNDLLEMSQLDTSPGQRLALAAVDLGQLALRACGSFTLEDDARRPVVEKILSGRKVLADSAHLIRAIHELLDNAYRYSFGRGQVAVTVDEVDKNNKSGWLRLAVRDQGIGMSAEEIALSCERFWRADKSGKFPGSGLGLSLVERIVSLHGGRLSFESSPGAGCEVSILLPGATA